MYLKKFFWIFILPAIIFFPANFLEAAGKPVVAVIPLDNQSTRLGVVTDGDMKTIATYIDNELTASRKFQTVDRITLEKIFYEFGLEYGKSKVFFDPATVNKIGKMLGAEYLVIGSLDGYKSTKGNKYTVYLSLRMIKVETAEIFLSGRGEGQSGENMLVAARKAAEDSLNGKRGMLTMMRGER